MQDLVRARLLKANNIELDDRSIKALKAVGEYDTPKKKIKKKVKKVKQAVSKVTEAAVNPEQITKG